MPTGSCPSCGAELKVKRGAGRVTCNTCGAMFKVKRAAGNIKLQQIDTFSADISTDEAFPDLTGSTAPSFNHNIQGNIPRGPGLSDRYFLVDTDHAPFLDGQSDTPTSILGGIGCMMLFLIPFIVVGLVVFGLTVKEWAEWYWLKSAGQVTTGRYDEQWIVTGSSSDSYYTSYFFYVNDVEYHDQIESAQSYYNFEMGARVDVLYWSDNPHVSSLQAYFSRPSPFFIIFTLFWNSIVYLFVFILVAGAKRHITLNRAKNKILVEGRIVKAKGRTDSDNDFQLDMQATFQSPQTGQPLTAREKGTHNNVSSQVLPLPGEPVLILYVNDQLYKIM